MNRGLLVTAIALCFSIHAASAISWDVPAFSLDPKDIAAAAALHKAGEGDDAVFLYEEDSFSFKPSGAAVHAYRVVYKLLNKEGIGRWSTASCYWQPWRQEKPSIKARVVSPEGKASLLDQNTIADGTAYQTDPDLYSDSRVLNGPLPNLTEGCVVEFEIVTTDLAPLLDAGGSYRVWFGHSAPVESRRLILECPSSMPLRFKVRGSDSIRTSRRESAGRLRLVFDASGMEGIKDVERYLASDVVPSPCIDFSTGSSWKEVSRAYADLAEGAVGRDSVADYASAAASGASAGDRAAVVSRVLYRIQNDVRYTGINFGENAILPHPPLDTLRRGYGDCKDQASLLVAVLRSRGIEANLALLMAGDGPDVQPGLPGFGLFNHAIVYLPGERMWIDPTASFYRPGSLPPMDQGRRALVISADTEELAVTPEAPPSETTFREVREFRLSEFGPAEVSETTVMSGSIESAYRADFDREDAKSKRERLERYVKNVYEAKALADFTQSDPRAMDAPFTIRLEAAEAGRGMTDDGSAMVVIQSGSLVDFLPGFLIREDRREARPKRVNDVRLWQPYVAEYEYRIHPPPGFRAAALPESQTVAFGPALYTREFRLEEDGSVTALVRFDCVKRVYRAAEAEDLSAEVKKFLEGKAIVVTFEQIGESLLASGKYREALEEFRTLAAKHPAEALHRMQISRALMAAGFGRDALAEARKAVELEPGLARAHAHLAWALLHDDFGRVFEKGADLHGARAEYARAVELDPSDAKYTANLAILYEYNDALVRYGRGADLERAVSLYRKAAKDIKGTDSWNGLAADLLYLGRYRELKEELSDSATDRTRQALFVAACAALDGPAAAQREAVRLAATEERRNVLGLAAQFLLAAHLYPESAELFVAGARGSPNLTQTLSLAEKLKGLKPLSPESIDETTPRGLMLSILGAFFNPGPQEPELDRYFASEVRCSRDPAWRRRSSQAFAAAKRELSRLQLPAGIFLDFFGAMIRVDTLPEGEAIAALVSFPEMPAYFQPTVFYLKREDGALRVVDAASGFRGVAREILASLRTGRPEQAGSWLRLLRTQHARKADFPDAGGEPILTLLPKNDRPAAKDMALCAAFELARSDLRDDLELGLPILLAAWRAEKDPQKALQIARQLAEGLMILGGNPELLEVTESMLAAVPEDRRAIELRSIALDRDGKPDRAEALLRGKILGNPAGKDPALSRLLAVRLAGAGRYTEAIEIVNKIIDSGKAEETDYNNLGWYSLYLGVPEPQLVSGRQLVQRLMEGSDAELHTLACILGDSGRMLEAQEAFGKYMQRRGGDDPDGSIWLAYGIMAERFGLNDTAIDAFTKVVREPEYPYQGVTSFALAQKHLQRLKRR